MKKYFVKSVMNLIKKHYNYDKVKLSEIQYGIEVLYLTVTKTVVIIFISILLGTLKELLLIFLFYGLLRLVAFGLHAKESWQCWIGSILSLIGFSYLSQIVTIPIYIQIIIGVLTVLTFALFAPADTEKRPLINKRRRLKFKALSVFLGISYTIIILLLKNDTIKNVLLFSLIIESLMILPITYKIFKLKYNNYKDFQKTYT